MATQFITNQEKLLSDVVKNILPSSKNLYFLVGYFYFSGFEEIYKEITTKNLKMLVGLDIENDLSNKIREYEIIKEIEEIDQSRGAIRENYYKSLVSLFNDTDFFDTKKRQDAFTLFLDKIRNSTLEIRKTLHPNHAKLYIFENEVSHNQGGEFPGSIITGSSNFTRSGLTSRFEINVLSRESDNYKEAYKIFDQLWKESVIIVDKTNKDEFLNKVYEKIWIDKLPYPYLLFIRVLEEYFPRFNRDSLKLPQEITSGKFINLKYQIDAIKRSIDILNRHHGVIIADVVGLGKSIIASTVAHNLNLKTIIIAPPHLMKQWENYRYRFDFNALVYSSGKIEQALIESRDAEPKLVIIDEAHKYRNEITEDYANLHKLCQRNKVMLLTATPFNNRPQDVFSMVKIFQIPTRSTIQTVDNLSYRFQQLIKEYKTIKEAQKRGDLKGEPLAEQIKSVASQIRNILSPLVIRRSRLDLEAIEEYADDLKEQKISFPEVHDPELLEYDLKEHGPLYLGTLEAISSEDEEAGFIGARYKPSSYIKDFEKYKQRISKEMGLDENLLKASQVQLAKFMRRLLVHRFESSISAFKSTLDSMINSSQVVLDWYEKLGKVPIYKKGRLPDLDSLLESTGEDLTEEIKDATLDEELKEHIEKGLWLIDAKEIKKAFAEDIRKDIKLLSDIKEQWKEIVKDYKLFEFKDKVTAKLKEDSSRKLVVFTEYADTADYLYNNLKNDLRVFKYTSADSTKLNQDIIKENFDAGNEIQKNDYDILVATDAISEGFNLHRAGIIFNYDIPYNPTRVIQRVGRINRINKKVFDDLYIYNFFPTSTGEQETRVKQISTLKLAMVHALFGEDTKVLTKDEELQSFFLEEYRKAKRSQEELSPDVRYENLIRKLRLSNPDLIESALKISRRSKIRRSVSKGKTGVLVFGKKGDEFVFKLGNSVEIESLGSSDAFDLFQAEVSEKPQKVSSDYEQIYEKVKKVLFAKRTEVAKDKGKIETINKIEALKQRLVDAKDYLEDLDYVVKNLDCLPERYLKKIRAIDLKTLQEDFVDLKNDVPHEYLLSIIDREKQIDEGKEVLILSEELI